MFKRLREICKIRFLPVNSYQSSTSCGTFTVLFFLCSVPFPSGFSPGTVLGFSGGVNCSSAFLPHPLQSAKESDVSLTPLFPFLSAVKNHAVSLFLSCMIHSVLFVFISIFRSFLFPWLFDQTIYQQNRHCKRQGI